MNEYDNFYSAVTQYMPLPFDTIQNSVGIRQLEIMCLESGLKKTLRMLLNGLKVVDCSNTLGGPIGPATENARSPKQVFDFCTFRSPRASDRNEGPDLDDDTSS